MIDNNHIGIAIYIRSRKRCREGSLKNFNEILNNPECGDDGANGEDSQVQPEEAIDGRLEPDFARILLDSMLFNRPEVKDVRRQAKDARCVYYQCVIENEAVQLTSEGLR